MHFSQVLVIATAGLAFAAPQIGEIVKRDPVPSEKRGCLLLPWTLDAYPLESCVTDHGVLHEKIENKVKAEECYNLEHGEAKSIQFEGNDKWQVQLFVNKDCDTSGGWTYQPNEVTPDDQRCLNLYVQSFSVKELPQKRDTRC